jgi:hypothetical protein
MTNEVCRTSSAVPSGPTRHIVTGVSGSTHSYSVEECRAFSDYINQLLKDDPDLQDSLPLNPYSEDLFKVTSKGLLLW